MRRGSRAWLLAGLAIAAGVGVATLLGRRQPKVSAESRILLVGDSMAQGLGPHMKALAAELGAGFKSLTVVGSRTAEWANGLWAELEAVIDSFRPTLIVVVLGTNDEYSTVPGYAEKARAAAELLLERIALEPSPDCYGLGLDVVWVGPLDLPQSNGSAEAIRAAVEATPDTGCAAVAHFPSDGLEIDRGPDGFHPTALGFAAWAGALWQWLA